MRTLRKTGQQSIGVDIRKSAFTHEVGSIGDCSFVKSCMQGVDAVLHTATLHKPHIATHTRQDFVDTNITGTLNLLEEASAAGVGGFVFTSTTSVFGRTLTPPPEAPAAWITEDVVPVPKNIYGVTKVAAENLCELLHRIRGLPCLILRTSRFFAEADDRKETRQAYQDLNVKLNEFLYRRVDLEDVVDAHLLALEKVRAIGFDRYNRERDDTLHTRRFGRVAREPRSGGEPASAWLRGGVHRPWMVDVPGHRPRLRQRTGAE